MCKKIIFYWGLFFLAGCENACSGHGQCTLEEGLYKCVCIDGWAGFDCSLALEAECQDDIDNDHGKISFSASMLLFNLEILFKCLLFIFLLETLWNIIVRWHA